MKVRQYQEGFGLISVLIAAGLSALLVLSVLQLVRLALRQVVAADYRSQSIILALSAKDIQRHCQQRCYSAWLQQIKHSLPQAKGSWRCAGHNGEIVLYWYYYAQQQFRIRTTCAAVR